MVGSRRKSVIFADYSREAAEEDNEIEVVIDNGDSYCLTRAAPCFWFPNTPFAFRLIWPNEEAPGPELPNGPWDYNAHPDDEDGGGDTCKLLDHLENYCQDVDLWGPLRKIFSWILDHF